MSGTAFAQLIAILAMPALTRIYAPEAFGILGIFIAVTGIIGVVVCMRYELAIVLPQSDLEAKKLFQLSLYFTLAWTLVSVIVIALTKDRIDIFTASNSFSQYIWLIPAGIAVHGLHLAVSHWNTRKAQFGYLAGSNVTQSLTTTGIKLGAGFAGLATGGILVIATIAGRLLATVQLIIAWYQQEKKRINRSAPGAVKNRSFNDSGNENEIYSDALSGRVTDNKTGSESDFKPDSIWQLSIRYRNISVFNSMSSLFNIAAQYAPILVLSFLFTPSVAGHYVLGYKILKAPSGLLGKSTKKVFYQRASETHQQTGDMAKWVGEVSKNLTMIGLFFMTLMITGLSPLVTTIFGDEWTVAGSYIPWIAIWVIFAFIANPLGSMATILSKEHIVLLFHVAFSVIQIAALAVGGILLGSAFSAVVLYSLTGAVYHGSMLVWLLRISRVSVSLYLVDMAPFIGISLLFIGTYGLVGTDKLTMVWLLALNLLYAAIYLFFSRYAWSRLVARLQQTQ